MDEVIQSGELKLAAHLARPRHRFGSRRPGLVLCHGFPAASRGAGRSEGQFSLGGWLEDLQAAVDHLEADADVDGVWLAGFRDGGSLSICLAGQRPSIRGVAALAARVDFDRWAADPRRFAEQARRVGVITDHTFPPDLDAWARDLRELRPITAAAAIPPRPFLVVHGTDDVVVPVVETRAMADAVSGSIEFRILSGAGHHLRHDPRAVAIHLGWLERQGV